MIVLVTGASGFIGRCAVKRLAGDGCDVIAVCRQPGAPQPKGVRTEVADLLKPAEVAALARRTRATHLLHLAWTTQVGQFWTAEDNGDWTSSSYLLLRAFAEAGGERAVIAGTCAEYDWTGAGRLEENSPVRPATLYGEAKDALRRIAYATADELGLSVAWGRLFWVYGPGEPVGRLVSDVSLALSQGRSVDATAGLQRRDFLHVDDVAGALTAALRGTWGGPFNIGSGRAAPVRTIVEQLAAASGRIDLVRFGARASSPGDPPLLEADTHILNDRIGYTPAITLDEGLAQTFAWWRDVAYRF